MYALDILLTFLYNAWSNLVVYFLSFIFYCWQSDEDGGRSEGGSEDDYGQESSFSGV